MHELKDKFSAALTFFFARKKIVQADFAVKNGMSETSLSDYKTGRKEGKETVRRKIVENFGLPYEAFLELGERILNGEKGDEVLKQMGIVVAGGGVTLHGPHVTVATAHVESPNEEPVLIPDDLGEAGPVASPSASHTSGETSAPASPTVQPMERILDGLSTYKEQEESRPSKRSSVLRQVVSWMDAEFARENLSRELDFMEAMKEKFPSFKEFMKAREGE